MAEEDTILAEAADGEQNPVAPEAPEEGRSRQPEEGDGAGEGRGPPETAEEKELPVIPDLSETVNPSESAFPEGPEIPEDEGTSETGVAGALAAATPDADAKPSAAAAAEPQKRKKRTGLLAGLLHRGEKTAAPYDMATHGSLVTAEVMEGHTLVERYWITPGCSEVMILKNNVTHQHEYHLYEPELTEFEYEVVERLHADLRDVLILTDDEVMQDREVVLRSKTIGLLDDYGVTLTLPSYYRVMYYMNRNFLGWARLEPLMIDPNLEDISCDGIGIPVFLYHRTYRNVRTNVTFDEDSLNSLAIRLSQRSGKHVSISNPVLDATLPDGSRLQLTYGSEVTTRGTSFTIRKFREQPFSPIELMMRGTFPAAALAYFWIGIENNKNLLFVGGTASGKTTSLNAVSLFLPQLSKVVSIEDTREITLYHENWIASVTRDAITDSSSSKIDMFDLLKAAMRQRPEYIIVGEVRGNEAQTLFQAMNTGHTTFSTMHANDVDSAIHRLENQPLNVPRNMVQALDIVSIQALTYIGRERVRRATEIVEIAGIDPGTGNLRVNTVFSYDPVKDEFTFSGRSVVYGAIMEQRGWTYDALMREVNRRIAVLNAMKDQQLTDYIVVSRILRAYDIDADAVMASIDDLTQALI
ncbi:Flp pilus assembly complex ATPase component TadA [Methanogenium sp. S4BF]|uniref:ATPase, T2SS/T4P/T4SS family n=1 Tax=Methanogenium sp. S4BF TaxID=1789226 RepID=UPI00241615F3|nr:ATPase, T2SS/T4P/T4SS family [Methanogenium sp. S4BF]WFN33887.1 Flp pilus assembly complex ATPase component TadA [Methanogenium sp. S4BF]